MQREYRHIQEYEKTMELKGQGETGREIREKFGFSKSNTLFLEFPCKRILLAEHLASIGVLTPPYEIKCVHDEDAPIGVKIFGDSEFESKLASPVLNTLLRFEPL